MRPILFFIFIDSTALTLSFYAQLKELESLALYEIGELDIYRANFEEFKLNLALLYRVLDVWSGRIRK